MPPFPDSVRVACTDRPLDPAPAAIAFIADATDPLIPPCLPAALAPPARTALASVADSDTCVAQLPGRTGAHLVAARVPAWPRDPCAADAALDACVCAALRLASNATGSGIALVLSLRHFPLARAHRVLVGAVADALCGRADAPDVQIAAAPPPRGAQPARAGDLAAIDPYAAAADPHVTVTRFLAGELDRQRRARAAGVLPLAHGLHDTCARRGDITRSGAEAVVTAANAALRGGGGVDGAVHRAAGRELLRACRAIGPIEPGDAVATSGFRARAHTIVHAVGPIWRGGSCDERATLARCYMRALDAAVATASASVALPAISCGVYGFPPADAVRIAVSCVEAFRRVTRSAIQVEFVCFDDAMLALYDAELWAQRANA